MKMKKIPTAILILLIFFSQFALSFSPTTKERMYKYVLKSLPPSLRELFPTKLTLKSTNIDYKSKNEIFNKIKILTKEQIEDLKGFPNFKVVIERFLKIFHLFAQLDDFSSFIKFSGKNYPQEYALDFERFLNLKRDKFVPIFYGFSRDLFLKSDPDSFLNSIWERNEKFYSNLILQYEKGGNSYTFDERSAAFGIASIMFSRTITDTVNIIVYIWWKSNGDISKTPFFKFPPIYYKTKKGDKNVKN